MSEKNSLKSISKQDTSEEEDEVQRDRAYSAVDSVVDDEEDDDQPLDRSSAAWDDSIIPGSM